MAIFERQKLSELESNPAIGKSSIFRKTNLLVSIEQVPFLIRAL